MKKKYRVVGNLNHDGKMYGLNDTVSLSKDDADALFSLGGVIEEIEEEPKEEPTDDVNDETPAPTKKRG